MSTTETATAPAAGWYADPTGHHRMRWWDGASWTERVADEPAQAAPVSEPAVEQPAADEPAAAWSSPEIAAEPEPEADLDEASADPMAGFDQLTPGRVPPAERKSTGAGISTGPTRKGLLATLAVLAVVAAALYWGWHNYESADRWRDRGEALAEQLETTKSNADAMEAALNRAASRGARMADSQQQMTELHDATVATVDQLRACASAVNDFLAVGGDSQTFIDRANNVCGAAVTNAEQLAAIVDALSQP